MRCIVAAAAPELEDRLGASFAHVEHRPLIERCFLLVVGWRREQRPPVGELGVQLRRAIFDHLRWASPTVGPVVAPTCHESSASAHTTASPSRERALASTDCTNEPFACV